MFTTLWIRRRLAWITDRIEERQTRELLSVVQQRLERAIGSSAAMLYELRWSSDGARLDWISDNVSRMLGYELAEVYAPHWWSDNIHPHDRERVGNPSEPGNDRNSTNEYRFRHKNGQYRWLRDERRYVAGTDTEDARIVGTWLDITERRQFDERLRHVQKMQALGALASGVAHDFNNTLTVVSSYAQLLLLAVNNNSALRPDVEEILKAADRGAALTQQLLAFSRNRVLEQRVISLNEVVRDMQSMLTRLIGADIELEVRLNAAVPWVLADPGQLAQVLMNLVLNARDAMPTGGKLTIETAITTEPLPGEGVTRAGFYSTITVTDTGTGMDGEIQARIFEPFFTTKQEGLGTGLGLSTVFRIIEQIGGGVSVSSAPGSGSSFTISIPQVEQTADQASVTSSPARSARFVGARVLLVEDDAAVRRMMRRFLERAGYAVFEAANGIEALERIRQTTIDVVISDTIMPEMGGGELVERLAVERPELTVILTSGYSTEDLRAQGRLNDAQLFIEKPFTAEAFDTALQLALTRTDAKRM